MLCQSSGCRVIIIITRCFNFILLPHAPPPRAPQLLHYTHSCCTACMWNKRMRSIWVALCAISTAHYFAAAQSPQLSRLISAREAEVTAIAAQAETLLSGNALCGTSARTCSACSYDSCGAAPDDSKCGTDFGLPSQCSVRKARQYFVNSHAWLSSLQASGQRLSKTKSGIKTAPAISVAADGRAKRNAHSVSFSATAHSEMQQLRTTIV